MRRILAKVTSVLVVVAAAACNDAVTPTSDLSPRDALLGKGGQGKVTVCHAAGRAGTTHFIQITISAKAASKHVNDNGTAAAGHEQDFIEGAGGRTCAGAPQGALLVVCKLSSALNPMTADPNKSFSFTTNTNEAFSLKFNECTDELAGDPGNVVITEASEPSGDYSYYATSVTVTGGGTLANSSGFNSQRPTPAQNAVAEVTTTAGNTTTVKFYNRN